MSTTSRRLWLGGKRFALSFPRDDWEAQDVVRATEGRRWDGTRRVWTVPATRRTLEALEPLGFETPAMHAGALAQWRADLERPPLDGPRGVCIGERELFPYQAAGVEWLRKRKRAILHDEQGTGKTTQAIAWAAGDDPVLVIAPLVLVPTWKGELQATRVSWDPHVVGQKDEQRELPNGWTLCSYERLKKLRPPVGKKFKMIVDEASYIKNPKTARSKLVLEWGKAADAVLVINGTLIVNRPIELWPILLLMQERAPKEFFAWAQRYCGAYRTPYGWDFNGATFVDELAKDIQHIALRRTKAEALPFLPPKLRLTVRAEVGAEGLARLDERAHELWEHLRVGESLKHGTGYKCLQELRVESAMSKVPFAVDWLEQRGLDNGRKTVVFSEFKDPLRSISKMYGQGGRYAVKVTGDESDAQREEAQRQFREDPNCTVLLATYAVGERGLNLQSADTVVILDLPWTPAQLDQAEDRVHRYGQTKVVEVVTIMSGHPAEEIMLTALENKTDIIEGFHNLRGLKGLVL